MAKAQRSSELALAFFVERVRPGLLFESCREKELRSLDSKRAVVTRICCSAIQVEREKNADSTIWFDPKFAFE